MKTIILMVFCLVFCVRGMKAEEPAAELSHKPQTEFLASGQFQSLLLVQPLTRGLNLEARLYRVPDLHENVMVIGGSYKREFYNRRLELVPGLNFFAGREERSSPAVSFRGKGIPWGNPLGTHMVMETSMFQALRPTVQGRHDSHVDVTHVSVETKRFAVGPAADYVQYREEHEMKVGARFQYKINKTGSVLALPLWPVGHGHFEFRGGVLFDPTAH